MILVRTDQAAEVVLSSDDHVTLRADDPRKGSPLTHAIPVTECTAGPDAARFWVRPMSVLEVPEIYAEFRKLHGERKDDPTPEEEERQKQEDEAMWRPRLRHSLKVVALGVVKARIDGTDVIGGSAVADILEYNEDTYGAISALHRLVMEVSARPQDFFRRVRKG